MYDYIVIGSGFGGSVSALRLAEKGYRVAVMEKGRRFDTKDFPATNWNLRKFLWKPRLGLYGIQMLTLMLLFHQIALRSLNRWLFVMPFSFLAIMLFFMELTISRLILVQLAASGALLLSLMFKKKAGPQTS